MLNCTTSDYDLLYARWLEKPETLLNLGGYVPGQTLLDICGGTGIVAKTALEKFPKGKKPDVAVFDLDPRLGPWAEPYKHRDELRSIHGRSEEVDGYFIRPFDLVVCRQAIGYLDIEKAIPSIAKVTKPGGKFVFSTFGEPRRFGFKKYTYGVYDFREAHLCAFKRVWHLQWCKGYGFDISHFKYHSRAALVIALNPWFNIVVQEEGNSLRFLCTRKG